MKILIPNSFCFAAIGIIKTLKRFSKYDVFIIGTGEEPYGLASGSKLTDRYFVSPPLNDVENYTNFLSAVIKENEIDLIICVLDADLLVLNKLQPQISATYVDSGISIIELFADKLAASLDIKNLGISIPDIIIPNPNFELICRKRNSVGSRGNYKVDLDKLSGFENNKFFVQKCVRGKEYTVDILSDSNGLPHMIIPRERIEVRNGLSFKTRIVNNQNIMNAALKICNHYKIKGLFNIQFIENENDLYFLELNPRFAGAGITGITASFNYLDCYIAHFLYGEPIPPLDTLQKTIAWDSIITRYYEEL